MFLEQLCFHSILGIQNNTSINILLLLATKKPINNRPHKLCYYKPVHQFGHVWPRLFDIPFAEHVATMMLQSRAGRRVSADQALRHRYFSDLPSSLHSLHPQVGESTINQPEDQSKAQQ